MLPKLNLDAHNHMIKNQQKQKIYYDRNAVKKEIAYNKGDKIYVQNYKTQIWEKGEIVEKLKTPRSYKVQMENGKILRRNVIHIRKRKVLSLEGSTTSPMHIDKHKPLKEKSKIPTPITTRSGRQVKKPDRLEY
ncbi:unnamed protein product [Macrosiphum euphorbiae]|uniref:Uncharacterized protein n=1 Tax=Macrosiphum euphorbiae TaxID=13131 RepID=A0AAV0XNR1_9HEMI|nr:unnamed protein product [Macrosiphum euphorbiae]